MKFLELYEKWMKAGALPKNGLCNSLPIHLYRCNAFELITPNIEEAINNSNKGGGLLFWGNENTNKYTSKCFTPQRQTIMLVAAALNGEFD